MREETVGMLRHMWNVFATVFSFVGADLLSFWLAWMAFGRIERLDAFTAVGLFCLVEIVHLITLVLLRLIASKTAFDN